MKCCFRLFVLLLALCILFSTTVYGVVSNTSPDQYVLDHVVRIASQDSQCIWTDVTSIDDVWVLYDFNDCPNGYIYTLETNGVRTGYIQINSSNSIYSIHSYSYAGTNIAIGSVDSLAESLGCILTDGSNLLDDYKLYYGGAFSYAIEYNGQLYDLLTLEVITMNREDLSDEFCVHDDSRGSAAYSVYRSDGSTMVSGYNDFTLVEMNDFAGRYIYGGHNSLVTNHCAPTASLNVLKYFAARGYSGLLNSTDFVTFRELYLNMNTNGVNSSTKTHDGTSWNVLHSDAYSGMLEYIEDHDVDIYDTDRYAMGVVVKPDLDTLKWLVTSDCPVILSVKAFPGGDGSGYHAVVMFGYKDNEVILSNGWDKEYHYYAYANLNVHQYYYVDFN